MFTFSNRRHLPGYLLQRAVIAAQAEVELRDVPESLDEVEDETLLAEGGGRRLPVAVELQLLRRRGEHLADDGAEDGEDVGVDLGLVLVTQSPLRLLLEAIV